MDNQKKKFTTYSLAKIVFWIGISFFIILPALAMLIHYIFIHNERNVHEINYSEYIIISGTYSNGDIPSPDIPFIEYSLTVPDYWEAKRIEPGERAGIFFPYTGEIYYTFTKNNETHIHAVSSYLKNMIDNQHEYFETDILWLEINGYDVRLSVQKFNDGYMYNFYVLTGESYSLIRGISPEYSEELKEEFISIIETFKIVELIKSNRR